MLGKVPTYMGNQNKPLILFLLKALKKKGLDYKETNKLWNIIFRSTFGWLSLTVLSNQAPQLS